MSPVTRRWRLPTCVFLLLLVGCPGKYEKPIEGRICAKAGIVGGALLPGLGSGECDDPIAGVRIRVAFDKEGQEIVNGFEGKADSNGYYAIETVSIPTSKDHGYYYLIFEKEGYERLVAGITLGPYSGKQRNTIILKRL